MLKRVFLVDMGILLDKNDAEFKSYNTVYDKNHGFYDEGQYYTDDLTKAAEDADEYLKKCLKNGYTDQSYYAVVSQTWLDKDIDLDEAYVEDEDYLVEDVVFSARVINGQREDNFLEGQERIFWMNRNISGLYEEGYPMTLEQLKKELESREIFDVEAFLAGDTTKEMEGAFSGRDTFTIREINSPAELKRLMSWEGYDPQSSHATGELNFIYPEFVHEDLMMVRYIYEFTGHTSPYLPVSLDINPTVEKYAEMFGYSKEQYYVELLGFKPTEKDEAMKRIADILQDGREFTVDYYYEILATHGLENYIPEQEQGKESENPEISEIILDWYIIHEADDDNGHPTEWSATLPNGEFLWIDKEDEGYALYNTHDASARPVSVSATLYEAMENGEDYAMELSVREEAKETEQDMEERDV